MDDYSIKSSVLRDIMRAMLGRDGDRLRPQDLPRVEDGKLESPEMELGAHDSSHIGDSMDGMSEEDAHTLSQLWDDGSTPDDSEKEPKEHSSEEESDEDDERQ